MRLIDADALEDVLVNHGFCYCGENEYNDGVADGFLLARDDVKEAPTIDAEPIRHGKWIYEPKDAIEMMFTLPKCSECGFYSADGMYYCSCCGARMDEVEE